MGGNSDKKFSNSDTKIAVRRVRGCTHKGQCRKYRVEQRKRKFSQKNNFLDFQDKTLL
jgi:hypothetical protein